MNRIIALSFLIAAGCAGQIDGEESLEQTEAGLSAPPVDRIVSLDRAETWMHPKIRYSNNAGSAPGGYRADCSGFVSMAWTISPPGLTTATLGSVSHVIGKEELTMGDVMLWRNTSGGMGHVVLFEKWADAAHTLYWAYEQAGSPYNGTAHRIVRYPYDNGGGPYIPHRYNQIHDAVGGAILARYNALGGSAGFLGRAVSDELGTPDGSGRFNHFQGGSIYWTPSTDAHEIHGDIRGLWSALGWERSYLGYPITDESGTPDGVGRFNHFQYGSIYWTQSTGPHALRGGIGAKWAQLGFERSLLGYPITNEGAAPDGVGVYQHFQYGSIYWTSSLGAHELHGDIGAKWAQLGYERSALGYPTSDEHDVPEGRQSDFEHGSIVWSATTHAVSVNLTP